MTDPPTDIDRLVLPAECREWLRDADPARVIFAHRGLVDLGWWNSALEERGLMGGPITVVDADGERVSSGKQWISRGDVFSQAAGAADSPERALGLLWYALAWGSGNGLRKNYQRMDAVAAHLDERARTLASVVRASRASPEEAYDRMFPSGRTLITNLGASFFTKFLYFAGGGAADHPCLILDNRVVDSLKQQCGWTSLNLGGDWPTHTYGRYIRLISRWQREQSSDTHHIRPDLIERWLFDNGRPPSKRRGRSPAVPSVDR